MDLTEIKNLYFDEMSLSKQIQRYLKKQLSGDKGRVENVRLLLLYRIFSNLYSALILTVAAIRKGKIIFYQFPMGILLRCCYTDCLLALYLTRVGKKPAEEELDIRTIEYANSLLERKEVYKDKVNSTGAELDDWLIDYMWELAMEDSFLGLLTFDDSIRELTVNKQSKQQLKDSGFSKTKSITTKEIMNYLTEIPELYAVATKMYHYYKYFSQYEHFSENGLGDVLESTKEDGNDNIHFPSAIKALRAGVQLVMGDIN